MKIYKHKVKLFNKLGDKGIFWSYKKRAVDSMLAQKDDKPTIGLILCQEKNEIVVEYSLKNMSQPIGISEYQLTEVLPKEFESSLPTIEMIENELKNSLEDNNDQYNMFR